MANGQTTADTPREPGEMERLGMRAEEQCQTLESMAKRLAVLSDRIQGCIPRPVDTTKEPTLKSAEVPAGGLSAVHTQIDRMSSISTRIFDTLSRLEEL